MPDACARGPPVKFDDSNGVLIPNEEWHTLPDDCEPYEEDFVLAINGIPPELIEDEENCQINGWCDG